MPMAVDTLEMARWRRRPAPGTIVHADRGSQYTSWIFGHRLREAGQEIPVLVTTSQTGKTADLLVEKLGAAGYLSKPLSAAQVTSHLSGYLSVSR